MGAYASFSPWKPVAETQCRVKFDFLSWIDLFDSPPIMFIAKHVKNLYNSSSRWEEDEYGKEDEQEEKETEEQKRRKLVL